MEDTKETHLANHTGQPSPQKSVNRHATQVDNMSAFDKIEGSVWRRHGFLRYSLGQIETSSTQGKSQIKAFLTRAKQQAEETSRLLDGREALVLAYALLQDQNLLSRIRAINAKLGVIQRELDEGPDPQTHRLVFQSMWGISKPVLPGTASLPTDNADFFAFDSFAFDSIVEFDASDLGFSAEAVMGDCDISLDIDWAAITDEASAGAPVQYSSAAPVARMVPPVGRAAPVTRTMASVEKARGKPGLRAAGRINKNRVTKASHVIRRSTRISDKVRV